jgi:hypothetical protein
MTPGYRIETYGVDIPSRIIVYNYPNLNEIFMVRWEVAHGEPVEAYCVAIFKIKWK